MYFLNFLFSQKKKKIIDHVGWDSSGWEVHSSFKKKLENASKAIKLLANHLQKTESLT